MSLYRIPKRSTLVICLIFLFLASYLCYATGSTGIVPSPQIASFGKDRIEITGGWTILFDISSGKSSFIAGYLSDSIDKYYNIKLKEGDIRTGKEQKVIVLALSTDSNSKNYILAEEKELSRIGEQGYILDVVPEKAVLIANTEQGIFYGVQTFLQLITKEGMKIVVPESRVIDFPKVNTRAVHFSGIDPDKIKNQLERIAKLKYNAAIIESQAYFYLDRDKDRTMMEDIYKYARSMFIEPIPELQSFGASGPVLTEDPLAVEGIRAEDQPFVFYKDTAEPCGARVRRLFNLIIDGDDNLVVKNSNGRIYDEGKDYVIKKGDLQFPYKEEGSPFSIVKTPESEISDGEKVLISYTYFENKKSYENPDSTTPYCPSTNRTYRIMYDAIDKTIMVLDPEIISIGHDEVRGINRDLRCRARGLSNAEVLAEDVTKLYNHAKSIKNGIKILVWSDMFNPYDNGGKEDFQVKYDGLSGVTYPASDLIPNDMLILLWGYSANKDFMDKSSSYFESRGFKYYVSGWNVRQNIKNWSNLAKTKKDCLGIVETTWYDWEGNFDNVKYAAETSWH